MARSTRFAAPRRRALLLSLLLAVVPAAAAPAAETLRYVRFADESTAKLGLLEGDTIKVLRGSMFGAHAPTGETRPLAAVRLLPPVLPRKVLAVGLNYRSHAGDAGAARPGLFAKLPTSVIGPDDPIPYPPDATDLHYEGELVVVIGRRARNVSPQEAAAHVFGVTAGNDVGERGWQASDLQWLRAKASDGFAPIGPVLVRGLDWRDLTIETRLNGKVVQRGSSAALIHSVAEIISFVSRYVTLEPGDLIFTGTPGRTGVIKPGDVVEVEIEGIGVLRNPVSSAPTAADGARPEAGVPEPARELRRQGAEQTDDELQLFLWAALAAVGVGGFALLLVLVSISPARIARAAHRLQKPPPDDRSDKEIDSP